jgi:hypothetical protein
MDVKWRAISFLFRAFHPLLPSNNLGPFMWCFFKPLLLSFPKQLKKTPKFGSFNYSILFCRGCSPTPKGPKRFFC